MESDLFHNVTNMTNRIYRPFCIVLATAATLYCVRFAISQSVPQATPAGRTNEPDKVVRAYRVPDSNVEEVLRRLAEKFPASSGVRITRDPRSSQILAI